MTSTATSSRARMVGWTVRVVVWVAAGLAGGLVAGIAMTRGRRPHLRLVHSS